MDEKLAKLRDVFKEMGSVAVAYSGGVDSAFVAVMAHEVLGNRALAVTADSPSLPRSELEEAIALASGWGLRHRVIRTQEIEEPGYQENSPRRCYFCKREIYSQLQALVKAEGLRWIANGTNVDDLGDFRPGLDAAREAGVRSPLCEVGLTKDEIRQLSKVKGLPTWDKPAMACLASRVPYGTRVTPEVLERIEKAEAYLRGLGIRDLRVRHHDAMARIEVDPAGIVLLTRDEVRRDLVRYFCSLGYAYVTLDLAGFRSGSMNEVLQLSKAPNRVTQRSA